MKLSQAILLGSTAVTLNPGIWYDPKRNCGCLLGGAMYAVGNRGHILASSIYAEWPWVQETMPGRHISYACEIGYFAGLVLAGEMTVDAVADWIRSVEPSDPEPSTPVDEMEAMYQKEVA